DLVSVITAAVDAARPAADEKGLQLDAVLDAATGSVFGDAHRLQQVVANLLSNAIKFTPAPGRVEVHLRAVGAEAEITVSDTGQGIPADFLPYVFERFRQADVTTTRAHAGLGLGLAIVRHLVELHGGRVKAESPGGGAGASFTVSLPLLLGGRPTGASAPSGTTPLPDAEPTLDGVHVLLVDDEADAREVLTALLEEHGARVTAAASAAEALERLERVRPDVLVSDLSMPDEDGYALIRRVRTLPSDRGGQIPAVALTAYAGVEDRERAFAAGFEVHVAKPVEGGELAAAIMAGLVSASSRAGRVRS
ncbi:MAG TPA: ATP-binding protein, partial [Methylomirabilota bacterium]|nr:ATP-binding protein [Methylomirabilota bacterium]